MNLLAAELLKVCKSPFLRGVLFLFFALPLVVTLIVAFATEDAGGLRWPMSAVNAAQSAVVVTTLLPPLLMAWLFGLEQSNDTWKVLLVRAPRRAPFLLAKLVVAAVIFLAHLTVALLLWVVVYEVVGLVFHTRQLVLEPGSLAAFDFDVERRGSFAMLLAGVLGAFPAFAVALLAAVLVPKNATVVGTVAPLTLSLGVGILDVGDTAFFWTRAGHVLAARLLEVPLVGTDVGVSAVDAVVVLVGWVVVPVAVALFIFVRRDVESGAG